MKPLLTAGEVRRLDAIAQSRFGISSLILMENAGRGVAQSVVRHFGPLKGKSITILCGKGNNGGDGFVAARHLLDTGAKIAVLLTARGGGMTKDARQNFTALRKLSKQQSNLRIIGPVSGAITDKLKPDVIVDALFGTGFSGQVKKPYDRLVRWMNSCGAPIVAVDVPSGINSDNGYASNVAAKASVTVTMGALKIGLCSGEGKECAGQIELENLGVPSKENEKVQTFLVEREDVLLAMTRRPMDAHKHSVGKVLIIAGSRGFTGAAAMVSQAAMRSGAGAVVLVTPRSVYPILAKKLTEVMVEPLGETSEGSFSMDSYGAIEQFEEWSDVVVLGPGMSQVAETQRLVRRLVERTRKPLLIDADGLNALVGHTGALRKRSKWGTILTPHAGELSRLISVATRQIDYDRVTMARSVAKRLGVTLVLKGPASVTAAVDGRVFINSTGNPGMATAGTGDVLAGVIGALWAGGIPPEAAAYSGVFIHGLAGDLACAEYGERAMIATDLLEKLPEAARTMEKGFPEA
jgi:hydroxyethylthiazole kinase-like uncharacterized protein yjeF